MLVKNGNLYLKAKRGHGKAAVAAAEHLVEAACRVLKKKEPWRERNDNKHVSSGQKKVPLFA